MITKQQKAIGSFRPELWDDGEFSFVRLSDVRDGRSLMVLTPLLHPPAAQSVARLERAYAIRNELDPSWAARSLGLERQHGKVSLFVEDPGGDLLSQILQTSLDLKSCLRIAVSVSGALAKLHDRDLIHRDIKPSNIIVNVETGEAWLTGFGLTLDRKQVRLVSEWPEFIAGTLAYMAPEQTGHMNRSVDIRSDLYSLGITLYEVLTGSLPFIGSDTSEWIHCHLTRKPVPLDYLVPTIPPQVTAVILKLLAKDPEERYQTATSLESDLRKCLAYWESNERFDSTKSDVKSIDRLITSEALSARGRGARDMSKAFRYGGSTIVEPLERIERNTIAKISKAVSSAIMPEGMIDALLEIMLEHAGADRGLLTRVEGPTLRLEADAIVFHSKAGKCAKHKAVSSEDAPLTVLRYVVRTESTVLIDNRSIRNQFSDDEYFALRDVHSLICLPLVRNGKVIGVLYLENSVASEVFTRLGKDVMDILVAHQALSLENAVLHAQSTTSKEALRRSEEVIRESERNLRRVIQTIPAFVWCSTADGKLEHVNERWWSYVGVSLEDGPKPNWLSHRHPEDTQRVRQEWRQCVATGRRFEAEFRHRDRDGVYRWFKMIGEPLHDSAGAVLRWYGLLIDVEDRKNAEHNLQMIQARLSRAAQLATAGELAASIAHEVSQPLSAIFSSAEASMQWLEERTLNLGNARRDVERIVRCARDAAEVVDRVRALFKRSTPAKSPVHMDHLLAEVLLLLQNELMRRNISVDSDADEALPPVWMDRIQVQQVLVNLILNAIDAIEMAGKGLRNISIRTKRGPDGTVLVEVRDYGIGLQDPDKPFDSFFTTKEKGLGMGLSISRSIIEAHEGKLWCSHTEGPGATFCLTLPVNPQSLT